MERIYGLIGRKLGHSYSVPIHRALGLDAYRLFELEPEELADFLAREEIGGLNVTIPYKLDVMKYCDVSPEAAEIGSVNTLVRRGGKLLGFNTDATGFRYMVRRGGISFGGRKTLVLGSGGASRTAVFCARALGASEVVVISRNGENNYDNLAKHADAEIVVNTTPVGMFPHNGEAPLSLRAFPRLCGVVDVVYNPLRTALLQEAEALGVPHVGGLSMLVAQAKAAEELFFDRPIDDGMIESVTARLRRETENIVLIGMPGSGKSTVGRLLAKKTGRELLELDAAVEKTAGKSIPGIFASDGEAAFRKLEAEAIREAGKRSGVIIATGGGAVKDRRNYAPLHQNGRIYEICRPLAALATKGRPLSADPAALAAMERERAPLYAAFRDVRIENDRSAAETAERIWRDFCEDSDPERA